MAGRRCQGLMAARLHRDAGVDDGQPHPALPRRVNPGTNATGLTCPDCGGSLVVRAEGASGYLYFRCRIGHAYGLDSLLAAKEDGVERSLWGAVTAVAELLAMARDVQRLTGAGSAPYDSDDLDDRIVRLQADADTLRRVAEANRALDLRTDDASVSTC